MPLSRIGERGIDVADQWRLMAVHAHPDDESSKGSATMAKYVAEGAEVLVVSCTGGERGDILNPRLEKDPHILRDIAQVRRDEMRRAQEILGVQHTWLGFVDSGLPEGDPLPPLPAGCFALEPIEVTAEALVREVRRFRPHVMTTYDETGGYPHPDHVMCHVVSMAAFAAAGDPTAYPHAGMPWQPLKIYYDRGHTRAKYAAYHTALEERGMQSRYAEWLTSWDESEDLRVTTRIQCADYFDIRDQALLAHATQVDPDGSWFDVPRDLRREVWPYETFEAAVSYVPVEPIESDLFAGIPSPEEGDRIATAGALDVVYDGRVSVAS
jgi:mycothiol S-conjugate amidase